MSKTTATGLGVKDALRYYVPGHPSLFQRQIAAAMLHEYRHLPAVSVYVPVALHHKQKGIWSDDVQVSAQEGLYLLVDATGANPGMAFTPDAAREMCLNFAAERAIDGQGAYAVIMNDGTYAMFED